MFRTHVLIVRRAKLYYTVSGIITPIGKQNIKKFKIYVKNFLQKEPDDGPNKDRIHS